MIQVASRFCCIAGELVCDRGADPVDTGIGTETEHVEARLDERIVLACVRLENRGFTDDVEIVL